jgi:hypothetical protein
MQARTWMVVAVLAASVALAACGSDSSDDDATTAATPSPATTATTTPAATTAAADDSGGEVSSGGENLAIGTRVVAPYVVYAKKVGDPQQNTRLGVTVLRVRKGKISDFKDFTLDAKQKATVPYYVDVRYENLGKLKLQRFLMDPSIEDSDGQEYKPLNLIILSGTFTKCPAPAKARLRPHEKFTLCAPILLPKGKTYERVRFQGDVTKDPYFWK